MITFEILCARFTTLQPDDLRRWITEGYVRPAATERDLQFQEIDVERVRLILELRDEMQVNEEALPLVLSLLDQLYALRRRMKRLGMALDEEDGG
ncbi:MerR family transcriptional regulator [Roseomonas hellenica]|uniref:MerR family transcriptional regulator n=1 Tax=Plastoroseomonas hellenica TaxID=2687306 RepID=A0ABS5F680_9PROT|nr:chaperone modulator CbpM [Plastoroseomonas hellenica]MBR0667635.1 MerR family transcriptional regulator [Plastoroseomonas hellenica]